MSSTYLGQRTESDIDNQVSKILRDLGYPEPPLDLDDVRELLEIDRRYYSSTDSSLLADTVHRLRLGGSRIIREPGRLLDVVRRFDLRALWLPDRKRILIDSELPTIKQRWGEAHEIGHSIIPWHELISHGDVARTLSVACQKQLEAEANFAAGRLLFLQDRLRDEYLSTAQDFEAVRTLSRTFGNSITTTLWRVIETSEKPAFALVSIHPQATRGPKAPVKYFPRSREFESQFSRVSAGSVFEMLTTFCFGTRGPIGQDELVLNDDNGDERVFRAEVFYNNHDALTLAVEI